MLDGVHLLEAYVQRFGMEQVQLFARASQCEHGEVAHWLAGGGAASVVVLTDALFDQASPVDTPSGLLAVVPLPMTHSQPSGAGFTVFVDGVQDPGNLGAILRSAAAAGGRCAVLSTQCADPWSPKCLRGGMGAQFLLDLIGRCDLLEATAGYTAALVAADMHGEVDLFSAPMNVRVGFIIGSEGRGLSAELLERAQVRVRIPMNPGVESLNAACAATLMFYEWRRRHG